MNPSNHEPLSPDGRHRREAMLDELLREVDEMRRSRRTRRRAIVALSALAFAVFTMRLVVAPATRSTETRQTIVKAPFDRSVRSDLDKDRFVEQPRRSSVQRVPRGRPERIAFVRTDPKVVDRYAILTSNGVVRRMDDSALLDRLISIGRPAGLIRVGDHVRLSQPVSDAELAMAPSRSAHPVH